ncbi:MAG: YfhO family protein [Armatimonadetes bacterium]|jgi:uncharacterized membrane protein YfhO|nr:YfhO family protein [Armatimonadota bacterium]
MSTQETQTPKDIKQEAKPIRWWTVALWAATIALLAMLPTIVQYKGLFVVYGDFTQQFIPMRIEAKRLLMTGAPWWSHNAGLGAGAGVLLTGSPFFWISMLSPEKWLPWAMGYTVVLKLATAACFSFLALKMFVSSRSAAVGAILYTFSGFTIINTEFLPIYADVIAFFPLLIIGTERVLRNQNHGFLILVASIAINLLVSFYMFAASSLFFVLYLLIRLLSTETKNKSRMRLIRTFIGGYLLGVGLASIIIFPKIYVCVIDCARAELRQERSWQQWLFFGPQRCLELVRVFFMPSEGMFQHAFYPNTASWSSTGIHLPLFGVTLVIAYMARHRDWLFRLLLVCTIITFVPLLNAAFCGFTMVAYTRWWFALAFLLALATSKIIDEWHTVQSVALRKYYLWSIAICTLLTVPFAIVNCYPNMLLKLYKIVPIGRIKWWYDGILEDSFMGGPKLMLAAGVLCVINYTLLWLVLFVPGWQKRLIFCLGIAAAINWAGFIQLNNKPSLKYVVHHAIHNAKEHKIPQFGQCRIDYPRSVFNYGLYINSPSPILFSSIRTPGLAHFQELTGCCDYLAVHSAMPFDRPALRSLLSVKYFVNYDPGDFELTMPGYQFVKETAGTQIYENEYFVPMGFSYDTYISESQLSQYSDCIEKVMLKAVVLSDDQILKYGQNMQQFAPVPVKCADFDWMSDAQEMKKHTCTDYTADSQGFGAKIDLEKPKMVFFSVPYGAGWTAFVDGKPAQIEKVNIGFLGLMLPAGQHNIEFRYFPPGLRLGAIVSGVSVIILLGYFIITAIVLKRSANRAREEFQT